MVSSLISLLPTSPNASYSLFPSDLSKHTARERRRSPENSPEPPSSASSLLASATASFSRLEHPKRFPPQGSPLTPLYLARPSSGSRMDSFLICLDLLSVSRPLCHRHLGTALSLKRAPSSAHPFCASFLAMLPLSSELSSQ